MAFEFSNRLDAPVEQNMQNLYETLSEKDRRRFAALQAQQLGHGAIKYLAEVKGVLPQNNWTRHQGIE